MNKIIHANSSELVEGLKITTYTIPPIHMPSVGEIRYDAITNKYLIYNNNGNWIDFDINKHTKSPYELVFNDLCIKYPEKSEEFITLLKLNNNDYRITCHIIETNLLEK